METSDKIYEILEDGIANVVECASSVQEETQQAGNNFSNLGLNVNNTFYVFQRPQIFNFYKSLMTKQSKPEILSAN